MYVRYPPLENGEDSVEKIPIYRRTVTHAIRQAKYITVCSCLGISQATFISGRKKYGNLGVSKGCCQIQHEDENSRPKKLVAELMLVHAKKKRAARKLTYGLARDYQRYATLWL